MSSSVRHLNRLFRAIILTATFACPASGAYAQQAGSTGKPIVQSQAELPRFTYELPTSTVSALLTDRAFAELAEEVRRDTESVLSSYTIQDRATLRELNGTLEALALLRGDDEAALRFAATVRDLQEKPAERLTSGLLTQAIAAAQRAGIEKSDRLDAFRKAYAAAVNELPWDIVQDTIEQSKGRAEIFSQNFLVGLAQGNYDQATAGTGRISGEVARDIIGMREIIDVVMPYRQPIVDVLQAYIDKHRAVKSNIWTEREVTLTDESDLRPVVIGIWDSGVDTSVYGQQVFRNERETVDGKDDDGDGFIDDLHGIAYGVWGGDPVSELLFPLDETARARLPEVRDQVKGFLDLQASIDSREARALKQQIAGLKPSEVRPMMDELNRWVVYAHGTHVAGIASAGNPAARILVVRETFPYEMVPKPITKDEAARWAGNMRRTVDYLERNDVRVVNMSWGLTAKEIEGMYELNGIGGSAEVRNRMAQETFGVLMEGMREAMKSAPGILFVPAAGNSDEDIGFTVDMPAAIDLPNVLSVGAVDQAGDETSFTCYGRNVRVHANGFEVESYLPGGERLALSGTSMAAPNVTNLAAKLFALDPALTPEKVVALIVEGANRSEDGRRVLINPRRSVELLRARPAK